MMTEAKFLDHFKYYDPKRPQCVESVRRLYASIREKAPELLRLEPKPAYWEEAWQKGNQLATEREQKPAKLASISLKDRVRILAQSNGVSCGQTACAMAINAMTGQSINDNEFNRRHGFALLEGLKAECPNYRWRDAGNVRPAIWDEILASLAAGCFAVAAANGRIFSPSGAGHIMLIAGVSQTHVIFADPNGGTWREVPRSTWEEASQHPDGNFVFLALPK